MENNRTNVLQKLANCIWSQAWEQLLTIGYKMKTKQYHIVGRILIEKP